MSRGSGSDSEPAGRQPEVHAEVDRLRNAMQSVFDTVKELEDRLKTVLHPQGLADPAKDCAQADPCILSGNIREQADKLWGLNSRLNDLINCLEV